MNASRLLVVLPSSLASSWAGSAAASADEMTVSFPFFLVDFISIASGVSWTRAVDGVYVAETALVSNWLSILHACKAFWELVSDMLLQRG